jgi:hypothetical protein
LEAVGTVAYLQGQVTNLPVVSLIDDGKLSGLGNIPIEEILEK